MILTRATGRIDTLGGDGLTMDNFSAGEVGGAFAGVVALLASLGGGLSWMLNWGDRRAALRDRKLQAWEDSLAAREIAQREALAAQMARLEALAALRGNRLQAVEAEVGMLRRLWLDTRGVLLEVTVELQVHAPLSAALARASAHLQRCHPGYDAAPDPDLPDDLAQLAARLDPDQ